MTPLEIRPETQLTLGLQSEDEPTNQLRIEISGSVKWMQQILELLMPMVRKVEVTNSRAVIDEMLEANSSAHNGYSYDGNIVHLIRRP